MKLLVLMILLLLTRSTGQGTPLKREVSPYPLSYLMVESDSSNTPVYVDKILMAHTPLRDPIPVPPGYHSVSFLPPEIQLHYDHNDLFEAMKQIYVVPGDTQKIFLETGIFAQELHQWNNERYWSMVIGIGMGMVALVLIWIAAL